jgi:phosphoserine phosphatase
MAALTGGLARPRGRAEGRRIAAYAADRSIDLGSSIAYGDSADDLDAQTR